MKKLARHTVINEEGLIDENEDNEKGFSTNNKKTNSNPFALAKFSLRCGLNGESDGAAIGVGGGLAIDGRGDAECARWAAVEVAVVVGHAGVDA